MFEAVWRGRRVAVKKLPPLTERGRGAGAPSPEAQYAALMAEIRLSSRFRSSRLVSRCTICFRDASPVMQTCDAMTCQATLGECNTNKL